MRRSGSPRRSLRPRSLASLCLRLGGSWCAGLPNRLSCTDDALGSITPQPALGHDTMVTSEWGTPNMVEGGLDPEILMRSGYGHRLHIWDLRRRRHLQSLDLGEEYQMALELRPAHDPTKVYGFSGAVVCLEDLSSSIWLWYREDD